MTRHNEGVRVEGGDPAARLEYLQLQLDELRAQVEHRDGLIESIRTLMSEGDTDGVESLIGSSGAPAPEEQVTVTAKYDFPVKSVGGTAFLTVMAELESDDWETVRDTAPAHDHDDDEDDDEDVCPFGSNRWIGATVRRVTKRRFVSADGEVKWLRKGEPVDRRIAVGTRLHVDDIPDNTPDVERLREAIRANTFDGYALVTRSGDYVSLENIDEVRSPEDAIAMSDSGATR